MIGIDQLIEATDAGSARDILRRNHLPSGGSYPVVCYAEHPRLKVEYNADRIWFRDEFENRCPILFQKAPNLDQLTECSNLEQLLDLIDTVETSPARQEVIEVNSLDVNFGPEMGLGPATMCRVSVGFIEAKKITVVHFEVFYVPTKEAKLLTTPFSRKSVTLSVMSGFLKK